MKFGALDCRGNIFAFTAALGASVLGPASALAAPESAIYSGSGAWTVELWMDGPTVLKCSARVSNPSGRPDFGSYLRLENDGKRWTIVSDYVISSNSTETDLLIDGSSFRVRFKLDGPVARAPADRGVMAAIASGQRLNLNLDPSGQNFSLRGAPAALEITDKCVRGHGLYNVGKPGINDYNGYDIAGISQVTEGRYGAVLGWSVLAAAVAGNFAYCTGEFGERGSRWRLGWDGLQWQIALPVESKRDWDGHLEVDGASRGISGSARSGWTFLWLGMPELDRVRDGKTMIVDIGRASIDRALVGTASVITKIEECVQRKGRSGGPQ